ncbi:MAG TPA: geranylgeranyl reductase family protein [Nitrospiraceae bacterium]|nr:geranylgeranyl reductase family protein [Nitrospiraceae bacterium]
MNAKPDVTIYDALVVGLGPAGAVAAYELSRAGLSVLALDKQQHPRYKVCGGGLSARIQSILDLDQNVAPLVEHTVYGVQFSYRGQESFLIESPTPIAYMVMRDRFDQALVEKARAAGTEVHEGERAILFDDGPGGVFVSTDRGRYHARVLIGADGANSLVAQQLFPGFRALRMPTLESEVMLGTEEAARYRDTKSVLIDIGTAQKGYAWVFPKHRQLSIGVAEFREKVGSPKQTFERFTKQEKRLANRSIPRPLGHPLPIFKGRRNGSGAWESGRLVNENVLLVGDAGHLVDPLFGEGIYYAVRSGQLAAHAVLGRLHDRCASLLEYDHALEREIYPEFRIAARMARIVYSFPRLCYRLMHNYQEVIRLYYGVLQGRTTYQGFFAQAKGLVKSSFRKRILEASPLR